MRTQLLPHYRSRPCCCKQIRHSVPVERGIHAASAPAATAALGFVALSPNSTALKRHECRAPASIFHYLTMFTSAVLLLVGCSEPKPPPAEAKPAAITQSKSDGWQSLFDGKTLRGWAITDFAGRGEVQVEDGKIMLGQGVMTGVTWTNPYPKMNYEVALDAMRVEGNDFFCSLTFPVGENPCSLIVGGWGGGLVGLSSLDGEDAANNETTKVMEFERKRWYAIKVASSPPKSRLGSTTKNWSMWTPPT